MIKFIECRNEKDYALIAELADVTWHEAYQTLLGEKQIAYMLNKFLTVDAIKENVKSGYCYELIYVDEIVVGFTAYHISAKECFLSKLYLLKAYQGKGIMRLLLERLKKYHLPITLTVNKYNIAYQKYLHFGFKVYNQVVTDIGSGYVMDDYLMVLDDVK